MLNPLSVVPPRPCSLGNKEFVFVFFGWKQSGITRHMAQSHIEKHGDPTTTKLHILKK